MTQRSFLTDFENAGLLSIMGIYSSMSILNHFPRYSILTE